GCEVEPVRAGGHNVDGILVVGEFPYFPASPRIPDPHGVVFTTGYNLLAIRAIRHAHHRTAVSAHNLNGFPLADVPNADRSVPACRDELPAVRAKRNRLD